MICKQTLTPTCWIKIHALHDIDKNIQTWVKVQRRHCESHYCPAEIMYLTKIQSQWWITMKTSDSPGLGLIWVWESSIRWDVFLSRWWFHDEFLRVRRETAYAFKNTVIKHMNVLCHAGPMRSMIKSWQMNITINLTWCLWGFKEEVENTSIWVAKCKETGLSGLTCQDCPTGSECAKAS